jgi:hypothetical protein
LRKPNWLGTLEMGVSRHDVVAEVVSQQGLLSARGGGLDLHLRLGTCDNDLEKCDELAVDFADPIA